MKRVLMEALLRRQDLIKDLKELESESETWRNSKFKCSKAGGHLPSLKNMRNTSMARVE